MNEIINIIYGYLHGIWRYRWSALVVAWIVALIGWLAVYSLPDQYQSRATVYIDTESIMKPLLEGLTIETGTSTDPRVIKQVLLSRGTLLSVLRETDMDLKGVTPVELERLLGELSSSIELRESAVGGGGWSNANSPRIYEIAYTSESADRGYRVVSKLLNTLIENALSSSRIDTKAAQNFLDKQILDYERRLRKAEEALAEFKKKNVGLMPTESGGYYQRLQAATDAVDSTRSKLRLARQKYRELQSQLSSESATLDSGTRATKLQAYQEKLAELQTRFTDQHPDVQALKAKIADLLENKGQDSALGTFNPVYQKLKVLVSEARVEVGALQIKLDEQIKRVEELKSSVDAMPQVEAELARLNRDYTVTKTRYLDLIDRRESARLSEEADRNRSDVTFRVIDPPLVPVQPSGPNRPLFLAAVLAAAMAVGIGWAVLRYFLHPTFADYKQLREKTGLPVLGAVSLYKGSGHKHLRRVQMAAFMFAVLGLLAVFGGVVLYQNTGSMLVRTFIGQYTA